MKKSPFAHKTVFSRRGLNGPNGDMAMPESTRPQGARLRRSGGEEGREVALASVRAQSPDDAEQLTAAAEAARAENAGAAERVAVLRTLITRHLGTPEQAIDYDTPLRTQGFHALSLHHLAAAIDLELGVEVAPESFDQGMTLAELANLVVPAR